MESQPLEVPAASPRIVYVDCITNQPKAVAQTVARIIGFYAAQERIEHWFNNYVEVIFDAETAEVVMFKHRLRGVWEAKGDALKLFKHQD